MRDVNSGSKKYTKIICLDEPGAGGACHEYRVIESIPNNEDYVGCTEYVEPTIFTNIGFQKGPIKENGVNGIQNEDLISIVIDRLQGFQSGEYSCHENACAITKLEEAIMWLRKRTQDREDRGVEGTSIK